MLVPFSDIPLQFLKPLSVDTEVHYTLDMKKFPGLSDDGRREPTLMLAPLTVCDSLQSQTKAASAGDVCLPGCLSRSVDAESYSCPQPPAVSLLETQKELFQLLDSYQLDYTDVEKSKNMFEKMAFPTATEQSQGSCVPAVSVIDMYGTSLSSSARADKPSKRRRERIFSHMKPFYKESHDMRIACAQNNRYTKATCYQDNSVQTPWSYRADTRRDCAFFGQSNSTNLYRNCALNCCCEQELTSAYHADQNTCRYSGKKYYQTTSTLTWDNHSCYPSAGQKMQYAQCSLYSSATPLQTNNGLPLPHSFGLKV